MRRQGMYVKLLTTQNVLGGDGTLEVVSWVLVVHQEAFTPHELVVNVSVDIEVVGDSREVVASLIKSRNLSLLTMESVKEVWNSVVGQIANGVQLNKTLECFLVVDTPKSEMVTKLA